MGRHKGPSILPVLSLRMLKLKIKCILTPLNGSESFKTISKIWDEKTVQVSILYIFLLENIIYFAIIRIFRARNRNINERLLVLITSSYVTVSIL